MDMENIEAKPAFCTIKLTSAHQWNKDVSFELDIVTMEDGTDNIVEVRYEKNGSCEKTNCYFINFVSNCKTFFQFFGLPTYIKNESIYSTLDIMKMLTSVPISETVCCFRKCKCCKPLCAKCSKLDKHTISTIGDLLKLIGCPDSTNKEYPYTYPDGMILEIEEFDDPNAKAFVMSYVFQ
jgi:hypothetical protein